MNEKHGNTTPTMCGVCGKEILAGTGKFVVGPEGVGFVHSGACAVSVGAVPGGSAAAWGERSALASMMIANAGMSEVAAAEAVKWRDTEGGVAVVESILHVVIVILLIALVGLSAAKIADAVDRGVVHAAVVADSIPRGGSR